MSRQLHAVMYRNGSELCSAVHTAVMHYSAAALPQFPTEAVDIMIYMSAMCAAAHLASVQQHAAPV